MKIKIFDDNKHLKISKIIALIFTGILLLWFTFDLTGLNSVKLKFVTSAFVDEPVDVLFYLIYVVSITCFILTDKIGKYFLGGIFIVMGYIPICYIFQIGGKYSCL